MQIETGTEFVRCRINPLYFIQNYFYLEEQGGYLLLDHTKLHPRQRQVVWAVYNYHRCIFMSSRQCGKTSIAAALLLWALLFYPGIRCIVISYRKRAGYQCLNKIYFAHSMLPKSLKIPLATRGRMKEYIELKNGSRLDLFYPSSTTPPSELARAFTAPILYIDEAAHIRGIREAYIAAQPATSTAILQAKKNNYPYFILVTSTPNGMEGTGEWFYNMYSNAIDADEIINLPKEERDEVVNDPTKNGFIKVRFHWSEDPNKDKKWYEEQCRLSNFDPIAIKQELDLQFLPGAESVLPPEVAEQLKGIPPINRVNLPHNAILKIYSDFDPTNYYIIGIDTAKSPKGDYCALEVYDYRNFNQTAEIRYHTDAVTKWCEIVVYTINYILNLLKSNRLIVAIEDNSYGNQVVEYIRYNRPEFLPYLYSRNNKQYGITTTGQNRDFMVSEFLNFVKENPYRVRSNDLISELYSLEETANKKIRARRGHHDDLFMASSFCAFVYRQTYLDILPLVGYDADQAAIAEKQYNKLKQAILKINANQEVSEQLRVKWEYEQFDEMNKFPNADQRKVAILEDLVRIL